MHPDQPNDRIVHMAELQTKGRHHERLDDSRGSRGQRSQPIGIENGIIGIGWDFDGLDIANMDRDQIRAAYAAAHPAESKQKVATSVGQVFRFAHSMEQGSTVVMYDPAERLYHIGVIAGPCSPCRSPKA